MSRWCNCLKEKDPTKLLESHGHQWGQVFRYVSCVFLYSVSCSHISPCIKQHCCGSLTAVPRPVVGAACSPQGGSWEVSVTTKHSRHGVTPVTCPAWSHRSPASPAGVTCKPLLQHSSKMHNEISHGVQFGENRKSSSPFSSSPRSPNPHPWAEMVP